MTASFWNQASQLVVFSSVVMDRPRGSTHPRFPDMRYPLDYGYLDGTSSGDGQGIDVWLGSGDRRTLAGIICSVDSGKRDMEVKLLLGCKDDEVSLVVQFMESHGLGCLLIRRP